MAIRFFTLLTGVALSSSALAFTIPSPNNPDPAPDPNVGTASRPLMSADKANSHTVLNYLAQAGNLSSGLSRDNWNPTAGIDVSALTADYVVTQSGNGTHTRIQSAINSAVSAGRTVSIRVMPGTYREVVCVPANAPAITLYGAGNPADTTLVFNHYAGKSKSSGTPANDCNPGIGSGTYGTTGSATLTVKANGFRAANMTFANDTDERGIGSGTQAVALLTEGDRIVLDNVRLLGNQDTFYTKTGNDNLVKRVYVKNSYIEGDVDFIFGSSTLVLDQCRIHYLTGRQGRNGGMLFAPSTDARNPYGFLVINSELTAESGTPSNYIHLGRAWDAGLSNTTEYYMKMSTGVYPNGQVLIRDTRIDAHIRKSDPWRASTASRAYSSTSGTFPANRFHEFNNQGTGASD